MANSRICGIEKTLEIGLGLSSRLKTCEFDDFKTSDVLVFTNHMSKDKLALAEHWLSKGVRYIYDSLWEVKHDFRCLRLMEKYHNNQGLVLNGYHDDNANCKHLHVPMFFWYTESLRSTFIPKVETNLADKKFLMPIGDQRKERDLLIGILGEILNDAIYSYVGNNIRLPNDPDPFDDRYQDRTWYQRTSFSLVVETEQDLIDDKIFLTEKTFKPIASGHAFLIYGARHSLALLKKNGFETFDLLFDESYDNHRDYRKRCEMIVEQINKFDKSKLASVKEAVAHNHRLFWNKDLVRSRIDQEITIPLKDFIDG